MSVFKWQRFSISPEQYKEKMGITKDEPTEFTVTITQGNAKETKTISISPESLDLLHGSKHLTAYTIASDIRKFEIGLFWQRAAFFWAFIVAIYTAYYHVLTNIYKYTCNDITKYHHGKLPLLVLSALGLFFCFSWLLASKGSKHWQENWELHLDLLEDAITGPLYKTYLAEKSYSVSKIVIVAGWVVTICAFGLLWYEFAVFVKTELHLSGWIGIGLCFLFALIALFGLLEYKRFTIGNAKSTGSSIFQEKVYEKGTRE